MIKIYCMSIFTSWILFPFEHVKRKLIYIRYLTDNLFYLGWNIFNMFILEMFNSQTLLLLF